jgi:SAM-dependent methyltransferase
MKIIFELLDKVFFRLKNEGFLALLMTISRNLRTDPLPFYNDIKESINGRCGVDIGGPSDIFTNRNLLPLYCDAGRMDIINYSNNTAWSSRQSKYFLNNKSLIKGEFFVMEASELSESHKIRYDFLASSHCLEHIANPIFALKGWRSALRKGGDLILVVPCAADTFDHKRPITTLDHLISDYERNISEDDTTHFNEVIDLHDLGLDYAAKDKLTFEERVRNNLDNRCLHHHTFDLDSITRLIEYCDFQIMIAQHSNQQLIIWAKK